MQVHVFKDEEAVLTGLADYFIVSAKQAIDDNGKFSVVLSGGSSPKKLYELLASDSYCNRVDWSKVYFFFGDERYVPLTDPHSNYLMAKKALFDPLQINREQVFPMDTTLDPAEAASEYTKLINAFFENNQWRFDLILLGLGDNSHTASLFPHTTVLHETIPGVSALYIDEVQMYRITLNAPLINLAHRVAFLVYGEGKAPAVYSVMKGEHDIENHPAQLIDTNNEGLAWFLDSGAGRLLK